MIFSFLRTFIILALFLLSAPLYAETFSREATFYSDSFDGGSTSNGRTFDQTKYSAAICGIDLGQYLYVSYGGTGIVVEANDRPNCSKYPNVIDLSREAFRTLAPLSVGRISPVSVTPIGWAPMTAKGFLPRDAFAHLGVLLTIDIPTILFTSDTIEIRGRVTDGKKNMIVYLSSEDEGTSPMSFLVSVKSDGTFRTHILLPETTGKYALVLASGNSFNTSTFSRIELIDRNTLSYPVLSGSLGKITPIFAPGTSPYLALPDLLRARLTLSQDGKTYTREGTAISLTHLPLRM